MKKFPPGSQRPRPHGRNSGGRPPHFEHGGRWEFLQACHRPVLHDGLALSRHRREGLRHRQRPRHRSGHQRVRQIIHPRRLRQGDSNVLQGKIWDW